MLAYMIGPFLQGKESGDITYALRATNEIAEWCLLKYDGINQFLIHKTANVMGSRHSGLFTAATDDKLRGVLPLKLFQVQLLKVG